MPRPSVLIVDHEPDHLERLAGLFRGSGYLPVSLDSGAIAGEAVRTADAEVLCLRLDLPGLDRRLVEEALAQGPVSPEPLETVERRHIEGVLRHTGGNRTQAASILGISRSTLIAKIRRYHLGG